MKRLGAALTLALLVTLAPGRARAQTESDSTATSPSDTTSSSPADTTETREFISTDGAVSVYKEARPGEGIEGFWWEYDAQKDLERLLDKDRKNRPLDPIVDPYGFELAIPDTIMHLRDSVSVVADSILAEQIEFATTFDPKLTSSYTETKDKYVLNNEFTTSYPLIRNGNMTVNMTDNQQFNQSNKQVINGRHVNTAFNYAFHPGLISTFQLNWADDLQERGNVKDSQSNNVTLGGTVRHTKTIGALGLLETTGGVLIGDRNYSSAKTEGQATQVQPNWKTKLTRDYPGGSATLDYTGNVGRSSREEHRAFSGVDSVGNPVDTTLVNHSDENNFGNSLNSGASYKWDNGTELKFTGSVGRNQFQYLSQVDSLAGRQETRTLENKDAVLNLNASPDERIDLKTRVEYHSDRTAYELEGVRSRTTTKRLANVDLTYRAWDGGRWIFKMETSGERRDYVTDQAGDVIRQKASADYLQEITEHIDFEAAYFVTLDRYEFDAPFASGERDLRNQRGTFDVRYNPTASVTSAVRMEVRKTSSVNLYPPRSGDNDTEHGFTITPNYTWKIGGANLRGDFTADARYKVQDYAENDNTLNRRFALRQSWQQAFSRRLSTETQYRWEFSDQGTYNRDPLDRKRRFSRSRETRGQTVNFAVLYTVRKGVKTQVEYQHDIDKLYTIVGGEKAVGQEQPRRQFLYSINITRDLAEHITLDLRFRQTLKGGKNISNVERNFYNITAQIVYTPFHVEEEKKK